MSAWAWVILGCVLLVMETMHGAFILSMLGLAALGTAVVALLTGGSLMIGIPAFVALGVASLLLLRPLAIRRFHRWPDDAPSGVSALVGQPARVVRPFSSEDRVGYILVGNEQWRARLAEGWACDQMPEGSACRVLGIEGTTLEVCPEQLSVTAGGNRV